MAIENRASFFERFRYRLTPADQELLKSAYTWAKYAHRGQARESGERYFEHLRETALILVDELGVTDRDLVIAALLHDVLEDSFLLTNEQIKDNFGERVETIVRTVTKPPKDDPRFKDKESRLSFHFQTVLTGLWEGQLLKLVDRIHNNRTLCHCSLEKQRRKRDETRIFVFPIATKLSETHPELASTILGKLEESLAPFRDL